MRLVAEGIHHSFDDAAVLRGASLRIDVGERVAVMGPSGSGKSTLLAVIGGILRPDRGRACMHTADDAPLPMIDVAWVLQTTNALRGRSVYDNVLVGTYSRPITRHERRERTVRAIREMGLWERRDWSATKVSGGELQRVSIARALVSHAPFVLADEPTGQLDHATSVTVLDALFSTRQPVGLLVATHDEEVADRCTRVLMLVDGRVRNT